MDTDINDNPEEISLKELRACLNFCQQDYNASFMLINFVFIIVADGKN